MNTGCIKYKTSLTHNGEILNLTEKYVALVTLRTSNLLDSDYQRSISRFIVKRFDENDTDSFPLFDAFTSLSPHTHTFYFNSVSQNVYIEEKDNYNEHYVRFQIDPGNYRIVEVNGQGGTKWYDKQGDFTFPINAIFSLKNIL